MSRPRYDVCAAVVSDLPYDARVWKEARSLAAAGHRVALIGCRYDIAGVQRRHEDGVDVVEIPLGTRTGATSPRERARALLGLWTAVLRTPARTYHVHNVHPGVAAWAAARLRRASLVYDAHELYGESFTSGAGAGLAARGSAALERFLVRRSRAVITTNPSRARVLHERYGEDLPVVVLANVPRLVEVVEPLNPGYPADREVVLYQGGIYAESRAFRETLAALRLLPEVHLAILGFGREDDLALIRTWAREEGVEDRVQIFPPRPFDELVGTAAAATVGIVPIRSDTLSNSLGDTNKLFEYLMAGLPVAASDLPEIRRVATEGDPPVGELFDASSPESIAGALRRILGDRETYEARRTEARRLAVEHYNWQAEERRLLSLYPVASARPDQTPSTEDKTT